MSIGDGRHQPCLIVSGFVERLEISIYTRWPCAGEASFRFLVDLLEAELELESDPFNAVFGSPAEVEGALGPALRPHSQQNLAPSSRGALHATQAFAAVPQLLQNFALIEREA